MDDETEIGFVEAHAERTGRNKRLEFIVLEHALRLLAFFRISAAGVGANRMTCFAKQSGRVLGRGHRQGVNDPTPLHVAQVGEQPTEAVPGVGQAQDPEAQGFAREGAANRHHFGPGGCAAQLFGDVGDHSLIGRGRRGKHRHPGRELPDELCEAPVVRAKVVAPVRDAVGFVDHEHADTANEVGQLLVAESRVVEPFG